MDANVTAMNPSLANYWWYEHLLCLPDVDTEIVTHFGDRLKELPTGNMPASLAVRLFLRQIMLHSMREEELLSVMGLFLDHSEKQQQFQSAAVAQAIQPPDDLVTKVLQQCLVTYCLQSFQQGQSLHDITAAVEQQTLRILQKLQLERLLESEQLKQSLVTLQYVLGSLPQPQTLDAVQQLLHTTFPKHSMEAHLQQFAKSAWEALGASSLEVFQRATVSGQLPLHPFLNFLQENEELQRDLEQQAQQQQAEQAGADDPAVAATPGEPLIVGGQQQELVIPDSTDPAAANKFTQPSSTPGIPSPRSGSDPAPAAAGGKQQRRVGDPAAAAVRGQLNLLPSTAAARNTVNQQHQHQQQYTAAVGEENTPPEEQAAVLQALIKTQAQAAAAAAARQQQLGRGTIQPPRPLAAAAVPVLTWEEQVMGHPGAGIAWGGDRRRLKNDKIRAEQQQTAEERARRKAEREEREAQEKAARKLLREQERARREEEKKAAEAARKAEAKAARAKQRQEEERRKEVERELARLQREEAKAAKQAEKEELKKERAAERKAAKAAGKKAISDSEEEMEIPDKGEEDEEEFVSIAEDSSSEDLSSESDGWSTESTSLQELGSDEAGDHSTRPAAAAAAVRKAGSKIKKPLPQAKTNRERISGGDSEQQASDGHGRVAPGRGRKPSKQAAAAAAEDSEDLFADLEVESNAESDQPAAACCSSRKRKPGRASEEPAATAGPSKKRKAAAAAAHGVDGRPARPDLEQAGVQAAAAAAAEPAGKQQKSPNGASRAAAAAAAGADDPAKQGLCGRGGPKTGAGRTVQWDGSLSEAADEITANSPSACQGPQTAAEMRAHLAKHRAKNGGTGVAAAMLELLAQKQRDKGLVSDTSDEEEADDEPRAEGQRQAASKRQAAAAAHAAKGEAAVDGSGGDVMNGSDEERQRRKRKKKQKKAAAAAAAAAAGAASARNAAAGGAAAARQPEIAGAAPAGAGAGPKASSSSTPAAAAEAESRTGWRRKVVRWSKQEEELLEQLVQKYGVGKWSAIKEEGAGTFLPSRTAVDLKDKWRNILKSRGLF